MPTLDITDDHRDRIETLREDLAAVHAGEYASVDTDDALSYLLDLADAVSDPDRVADPDAFGGAGSGGRTGGPEGRARSDAVPFDRDLARERLESRNRRHGDPDDADEMDLYAIAAAFDVTGRSDMTKGELVDAVLDAAERLAADPFSHVDVDLGGPTDNGGSVSDVPNPDAEADQNGEDDEEVEDGEDGEEVEDGEDDEGERDEASGGSSQLDAMMSLLDTHDDKWREADGDVRYEVDLPDGSVETARTKDDVRALLFRNY